MTNNQHGQVPEALIDLIDAYAETRHRCGGIYNAKTEAARKAVIEALSGVQALSAAPAGFVPVAAFDRLHAHAESLAARLLAASPTPPAEQQANGLPSGQEPKYTVDGNSVVNRHTGEAIPHDEPIFVFRARDALSVRALEAYLSLIGEREPSSAHAEAVRARIADFRRFANTHQSSMKWPDTATQTVKSEPLQQAAPKAAPGVGNSGFDYKTAADFLNGKTVSDEAVRKFAAASRWAHDERAALSATLLAMHGVLTSREAEIALLKKALLEAEAAPQPAPAPLSDDAVKDAARWRMVALIGNEVMLHPEKRTQAAAVKAYMDATRSGLDLTGAVDAALAAQVGKV